MTKKYKILGVLFVGGLVLAVAFNNCAKASFSNGTVFNPLDIQDIQCSSVQPLTLPANGSPLVIPAHDSSNSCYSVKLISAVAYSPTTTPPKSPYKDSDVWSFDYDSHIATKVFNPYLLGKNVANIFMQGERSVKLSGSPDGTQEITVDNFVLVGVMSTGEVGASSSTQFYKAYGTSDCHITSSVAPYANSSGLTYVAFGANQDPVLLTPFASNGTASITPWRVDGQMQTLQNYSLDVRALDCGGSQGNTSDIYLFFQ